jgi:hypothetical protein
VFDVILTDHFQYRSQFVYVDNIMTPSVPNGKYSFSLIAYVLIINDNNEKKIIDRFWCSGTRYPYSIYSVLHPSVENITVLTHSWNQLMYYFRLIDIKTMFGSSLVPFVRRRAHILFMIFLFVCVWWCPSRLDSVSNMVGVL